MRESTQLKTICSSLQAFEYLRANTLVGRIVTSELGIYTSFREHLEPSERKTLKGSELLGHRTGTGQ